MFLKKLGITLGTVSLYNGTSCSGATTDRVNLNEPDITYNTLQLWRGFNLQEKFTHKPDEWMNIAPEWGFRNEPFRTWKELENKGVGVYVGEFGVYNRTPHDVTLSFLKDNLGIWRDNGWGWAMWCFRGSFGVADSGRKDVKYEKFRGVMLDREMVELLKQ